MRSLLPLIGTSILLGLAVVSGHWARTSLSEEPGTIRSTNPEPEDAAALRTSIARPARRSEVYYAAINQRPLFSPTRRPNRADTSPALPTAENQLPAPEKAAEPPEVTILGVILAGQESSALISIDGGASVWVRQEDAVADWTLNEIGPDWIEIGRQNQTLRLGMYTR